MKWKIKANVQRSERNWRKFVSLQMSASWCNQWNEGVSKLTRRKSFLGKILFCGNVCVYHTGHMFYFRFMEVWMKWNEIYIFFFNKIYKTRKLINYLIFMIRKYKESKIVKKCLRWINLLVVSRDKCNNGIKKGKILVEAYQ